MQLHDNVLFVIDYTARDILSQVGPARPLGLPEDVPGFSVPGGRRDNPPQGGILEGPQNAVGEWLDIKPNSEVPWYEPIGKYFVVGNPCEEGFYPEVSVTEFVDVVFGCVEDTNLARLAATLPGAIIDRSP